MLSILYFPNFFIISTYFLYLTLLIISPATGMDIFEEEMEMQPLHGKFSNIHKKEELEGNHEVENEAKNSKSTTENIPLLLSQPDLLVQSDLLNPLIPYIHRYVVEEQQIEESSYLRKMRLGIKVFTILYGATGGVPYISATCNAGQGIMFLCASFATGNVIASGGSTIWAGLRITEYFDPISKEEKEILHTRAPCSALKHVACNVLGILASIPGTYSVYKYNLGNLKFLVIPGFLNNYIFSTSGYYEIVNPNSMFQQVLSKFKRKDTIDKESDEIKERLINHIRNHVIPSIINDSEARKNLFEGTSSTGSIKDFIGKLFSLKYPSNIIEPPEKWKGGYPRKITQGMSLIFPLGNAVVNYFLGYETANLLIESPIFCNVFSAMVVTPNFMLDVLSSTSTASNFFDVIYNKAKKRNSANVMSSFYPRLNLAIPVVSVALACLSVTGGWVVSHDAIVNSELKSLVYILPTVVFISNAISQSFQVRDLLYDTINYFSTFRKDSAGETISKINKLEKFTSIISNCVPSIFYDFWNNVKN